MRGQKIDFKAIQGKSRLYVPSGYSLVINYHFCFVTLHYKKMFQKTFQGKNAVSKQHK